MINLYARIFSFVVFILSVRTVQAQDTIRYKVTFPNAVHHECEISVLLTGISEEPLQVIMSNSSPGRYANHYFAKNIYGLKAYSIEGEPVELKRTEPNMWTITPANGYIKFNYTLFGDYPDGTYSGFDRNFAHFNMPSAFIWFKGLENTPIKIDFEYNSEKQWQIATQLKPINEHSYFAPNLQYFMDSPTIIGNLDSREFTVKDGRQEKNIHVFFNPDQADSVEDKFTEMVRKVVLEERAVFGELPDYDYSNYSFLGSFSRAYYGDGMEHRNSTMITESHPLRGNEMNFIGTYSHEFFHCWNVERIRPKSLEPFNFAKVNMSSELWFAEGFTSYYGPLSLFRSGVYDTTSFLNEMSGMINYVLNSPGTGKYSLDKMSQKAPFVDASSFIDITNFKNTYTSYYPYGAVIGLALDLSLRTQFKDMSLDNFMKFMWVNYGRNELPYTNEDLQNSLVRLTGDQRFATSFFDKYIFGLEVPDFDMLLQQVGYRLMEIDTEATDLSVSHFQFDDDKIIYATLPYERSTFYVAGLDKGDELTSINGNTFKNKEELEQYFKSLKIGTYLKVKFNHYDEALETVTLVKPGKRYVVADQQKLGEPLSDRQKEMRDKWLGTQVKK